MLKKIMLSVMLLFILIASGPVYLLLSSQVELGREWRHASRQPAHTPELKSLSSTAVIVLFSARTFNWRGLFAVHTWIAMKSANKSAYTVIQCIGWNRYLGRPLVDVRVDYPDRYWFGAKPKIVALLSGPKAALLIPKLRQAVVSYPYATSYRAWPGPNSNSFISYILRRVPSLGFRMPYNALGYDYGWSFSWRNINLGGVLGYHITRHAFVVNILGLTAGVTTKTFGVIVPGIGEVKTFK